MSNYTQITFFAPKDALLSGNPAKLIKGADVDPELAAISTAIASKYDSVNFAFANPTGTIGLAAVNGTSTNPMRSDAAPALSQAISPTMTGVWAFNNGSATPVAVTGPQGTVASFAGPNTGAGWNVFFRDTTNSINRGFIGIGTNTVGGAAVTDFAISPGAGGSVVVGTASGGAIGTRFGPNGNVTVNAPSAGTTLTLIGLQGTHTQLNGPNTGAGWNVAFFDTTNSAFRAFIGVGTNTVGGAAATDFAISPGASGSVVIGTANGGSIATRFGPTGLLQTVDDGGTLQTVGWRDIPSNAQTVNYTTVMADRGKGIDMNGANLTATIAANASVAYPVGTVLVFSNLNATNLSIAINSDTLTLAGTTTTGTRTLAQNGQASARKVTATSWLISGSGLS